MKPISLIMLLLWTHQSGAVKTVEEHIPLEHQQVTVTRAELAQAYPIMDIKCGIQIMALDQLNYAPKNVRTKPNRYIFADWEMGWNQLLCEFKRTAEQQ